ncbi:breast carcinoma-amplified sequence 1 [Scleropages formosus]|nr:breast carcinoma-amplified sequence 1 [Scleropages formosus]
MGNEASYEMQDHKEVNGKLQNGGLNGHAVSISLKEEPNEMAVQQFNVLPTPPIAKDTAPTAASEPDGLKAPSSTPQVQPSPNKPDPPSSKAPENPSSELVNTEVPTEGQSSTQPPHASDPEEEPKPAPEAKVPLFNKLFKKKTEDKVLKDVPTVQLEVSEGEKPVVMTVTIDGLQSAPGRTKEKAATTKGSNGLSGTPVGSEAPGANGESVQAEETKEGKSIVEENPVMNFFKTFTKGPKEPEGKTKLEKGSPAKEAVPSATEPKDLEPSPKDSTGGAFSKLFRQKSFKDTQPTTTNGVQEVDAATAAKTAKTVPPPEPPKAETKAEPAAKNIQKEGLKDVPSGPETSAKKPSKGGRFSKLFSSKPAEKEPVEEKQQEEVMEVEEEEGQTAASKASTLEATPPPEQPPKPMEKKKSNLISIFKTKVPQRPQTSKVQAVPASGNSVTVNTEAPAPEATKETPPEAPPLPEAAPSAKAKEEPKPPAEAEKKKSGKQEAAPKAKAPEVTADNKLVSEALPGGDDVVPSVTKKLEKRNSIHLFFKSLGPKRLSEVGVQTDPVTITYPSEKAK